MQDRPDLIISELSGLAFDSLQQAFRPCDLDIMFTQPPLKPRNSECIYIAIDPAAGGRIKRNSVTDLSCTYPTFIQCIWQRPPVR